MYPFIAETQDSCPSCRRALCVQLPDPAAPFPSATGAGAQQGLWCCCLGDAPQCSPTQHPPAPRCCAGCLPSPQLCWVIPITAHSMTETLPKAAPLAVCIPSQGLSPCPHPIAALSWAGPIFLGLCCSLQWDSCFPSLFSSYNFLFLPMEGGMLLAVQVPSNLKFGCQVDLAQDELPARQRCSLQKG